MHLRKSMVARLSLVFCMALAAACTGKRPLPGDPGCALPMRSDAMVQAMRQSDADFGVLSRADALAMVNAAGPRPLRYLALSGGGEQGAFGAGFLKGWADATNPSGALPEFDIVTGVSTGALLATFAFIGDPDPLRVYTEVDDAALTSRRPLLLAIFSDALFDNAKLRERVNAIVSDEVLAAVAERARMGRKLRVGAVNLDTNEFQQFRLDEIAVAHDDASEAERPRWRDFYVESVVASTAIPIVFPPSYVGCEMYVDGGARQQIFLESAIDELMVARGLQMQMQMLGGADATAPGGPEIYGIVNGNPALLFDEPADNSLIGIGGRSIRALLNANLLNDLGTICRLETDVPVQLTDIGQLPDDVVAQCESQREKGRLFPQAYMQCLYGAAEALWGPSGTDATPWKRCP